MNAEGASARPRAPRGALLRDKEVAEILRVSVSTLTLWRSKRIGPPFIKIGNGVRYPEADLETYLEAGRRPSPSQAA
ncbi:helix-turn-helix transcriptional regulator [Microvirga sp. CF3016]|uniref:helix-turn-helix transcriptional regulator n=1 Tax=Microvirga sp. CF3016 TaxID=3110181 RepID=UPI002E766AEE|nr:helix-turn-helix domain-containing protein [Microvirga sp. CF3016]MEE1611127.1 helix-turn-helix domain-containing protein [Microvirga sp. CF3016]